jgi:ABC-2 type transport system permease protein
MFNLVLKDILIQKKTFVLGLFYIPIMAIAFQHSVTSMIPAGIVGLTYIVLITACAYDDKYKTDIMLNSLPLHRNSIVLARYMSLFLYYVIGVLDYVLFTAVISTLGIPIKMQAISVEALIAALGAVVLVFSTYLPVFYKFGYIKSRTIGFVLFFVFFFGIGAVSELLQDKLSSNFVRGIAEFFEGQSDFLIGSVMVLVILLILASSYMLSAKIYKTRDF